MNRRRPLVFAAIVVAVAAVSVPFALTLAPALLLLAVVASGRRPGEELIERLSAARARREQEPLDLTDGGPAPTVVGRADQFAAWHHRVQLTVG